MDGPPKQTSIFKEVQIRLFLNNQRWRTLMRSSDTGHKLSNITSRMDEMFEILNAVKMNNY